jgi:hypothetical protein
MIIADNETHLDLLNNEAITATIIKLLRDQRTQLVTVGVHGDWGAGRHHGAARLEAAMNGNSRRPGSAIARLIHPH